MVGPFGTVERRPRGSCRFGPPRADLIFIIALEILGRITMHEDRVWMDGDAPAQLARSAEVAIQLCISFWILAILFDARFSLHLFGCISLPFYMLYNITDFFRLF